LPIALLASGTVFSQETDERIQALENEVAILKSANQNSMSDRLKFNGFYSVGVTRASNDAGYADSEDSYSFDELTLIGLQGEFALGDSTSVVAQILAKGIDDFDMSMEWAYIKHTFDNDVTVRGGKLRVPLFMYSDFLDVGFAQPWVRPPLETYVQVPFNSYIGGDISYDIEFSESVISLQAFGGESTSTRTETVALDPTGTVPGSAEFDFDSEFGYLWGTSIAWNYDSLTLRGVYGTTVASSNHPVYDPLLGEGSQATFYGAGFQYDNGELLVVSEYTSTEIEGLYPDVDSYYATVGYRFGNFMPYFNYGYAESQDDAERNELLPVMPSLAAFNGQRSAYSVGLRYELLSNLAIKGDVTFVNNMDGTAGFLANNATSIYEDTTVYSIRIDGVF
jgi:hypothetical protein